jgi:diadenosine tetraphosphate (Ap4A) HIT family hydrolase
MTEEACAICAVAAATADEDVVYRSDAFTVAPAPMQVPGWFLLWTNRHDAYGLWELTDGEASEFGRLVRVVAAASRDATGAERLYLMALGEHALHFHAMVLARTGAMPLDVRGPGLLAAGSAFADPALTRSVAVEVRTRLLREAPKNGSEPEYPPSRSEHLPS